MFIENGLLPLEECIAHGSSIGTIPRLRDAIGVLVLAVVSGLGSTHLPLAYIVDFEPVARSIVGTIPPAIRVDCAARIEGIRQVIEQMRSGMLGSCWQVLVDCAIIWNLQAIKELL